MRDKRISSYEKDGLVARSVYSQPGDRGADRAVYCLTTAGRDLCRRELCMTHLYSAQNPGHDLAIADRYFSLTPEERDTWKTESECRDLFTEHIRQLRDQGEEERARESRRGSLVSAGTVESAIYDLPDGARVIYAVNTDWYSDSRTQADAVLRAGGYAYPVKIRRGMLHAFFVHGAAAAACGMDTEILGLEERSGRLYLRVQGPPGGLVTVYRDNRETSLALRQAGVSQLIL